MMVILSMLHRIVAGTWAWAWWWVTDVQKIALGIRVTIIASLLISCHLLALLSYESLALTFFSRNQMQPTQVTTYNMVVELTDVPRHPFSHQTLIIVPTRRCTQSATM